MTDIKRSDPDAALFRAGLVTASAKAAGTVGAAILAVTRYVIRLSRTVRHRFADGLVPAAMICMRAVTATGAPHDSTDQSRAVNARLQRTSARAMRAAGVPAPSNVCDT